MTLGSGSFWVRGGVGVGGGYVLGYLGVLGIDLEGVGFFPFPSVLS